MLNDIAALECESSCAVLGRKRDRKVGFSDSSV